jgi:hypothetical protein
LAISIFSLNSVEHQHTPRNQCTNEEIHLPTPPSPRKKLPPLPCRQPPAISTPGAAIELDFIFFSF